LGIKNLEMLVSIYKNWPNDARASAMSMEDFMEMEGMLMEKNEDDMGKICFWKWMITLLNFRVFFVLFAGMMKRWQLQVVG